LRAVGHDALLAWEDYACWPSHGPCVRSRRAIGGGSSANIVAIGRESRCPALPDDEVNRSINPYFEFASSLAAA
jgi:hypothetical protein